MKSPSNGVSGGFGALKMGRIEIPFNGISSRLDDDAESIEDSEAGYSGTLVFVFCSLIAVRDGFARDCPHRHPVPLMLALRDRSGAAPSFFCECRAISTVAGAAPRRRDTSGARWRRYAGDRLASRFPWSGWGARESLPGHPSHGRRIGPRHGPILSPSPSVVAPARVASRGHPGLSRIIPG